MSRYAAMFRRSGNAGVFGAFVMLGDPDLEPAPRSSTSWSRAGRT